MLSWVACRRCAIWFRGSASFSLSPTLSSGVLRLSTSRSRWRGPTAFVPTYSGGRTRAIFSRGCRSLPLTRSITSGPTCRIRVGSSVLASCCLRPVVAVGDLSVDFSPAVADHFLGPSKLSVSAREVIGRGVLRQPIISGICSQAGRNSLVSPESGGLTPASVDGESIDSSSSVRCGHSHRGCLLSLATQRSAWFQVDPSAGRGGSTCPSLASKLRPICHSSESSDASLLCSDGGPSVVWHRLASSILQSYSIIRISSFSAGSSGLQRVLGVEELRGHSGGSMVASTGIFLRFSTTGSVPSGGLASSSRLSSTAPLCRSHLNPRLLRLHGWKLWGVLRGCGYV